jgi:hypothetical protein
MNRVHLVRAIGIGHGRLELGELGRNGAQRAGALHDLGDRAPAGHLADILAEIPDRDPSVSGNLPLVRLFLPGDHPEQRRLSRPVRADETDLLAPLECGGRLDEDDLLAVLLADSVEEDHALSRIWALSRLAPLTGGAAQVEEARRGEAT